MKKKENQLKKSDIVSRLLESKQITTEEAVILLAGQTINLTLDSMEMSTGSCIVRNDPPTKD